MRQKTPTGQIALEYTTISLAAALVFLTAATLAGSYGTVARLGGTVWVFMLTMIVTMPLVTGHVKERNRN